MPYISQVTRDAILHGETSPATPGELNYLITEMVKIYLGYNEKKEPKYSDLNEVIGVLECCKLEFYRRIVADYEDERIEINGDVY
jgi:hypothetical protein